MMSRTANFAHELVDSLQARKTKFSWDIGKPPSDNRECVDVVGDGGKRFIFVEVELRRIAPVANIAKIWKWLDTGVEPLAGRKITVIQAFSSFYDGQGPSFLKENSEFLGRQLEIRFKGRVRYMPIPFKYKPYKKRANVSVTHGGGAMLKAARRLANKIALSVKHT
jgi:hypothetical protein